MIWRTIQAIGGVIAIIGFVSIYQGKTWWSSAIIIGAILFAFGWVMRFITKDK